MKKMKFNLSLFFVFALFLTSCSSEDSVQTKSFDGFKPKNSSVEFDASQVGIYHNAAMSYMNTKWDYSKTDENDLVNSLSSQEGDLLKEFFNNDVVPNSKLTVNNPEDFYNCSHTTNSLYRDIYLNNYTQDSDCMEVAHTLFKEKKSEVLAQLNSLVPYNKITQKEVDFMTMALERFDSIEALANYSEYPTVISELRNSFENQKFEKSAGEGNVSEIFIEVADNSYNYWTGTFPIEEDPNDPPYVTNGVPLWVGLDAVGAAAGAASSLWSQRNNRDTDWWEVGGQAVIWGAAGSIVGARPFLRLFKK